MNNDTKTQPGTPSAFPLATGSASDFEAEIARISKQISRLRAKQWSIIGRLRAVCPHDGKMEQFEGDDRCPRCGLIADTILPNGRDEPRRSEA